MDVTEDISKLKNADQSGKLELYPSIIKKISDLREKSRQEFVESDVDSLSSEIAKDLESNNLALVELVLNELKLLLKHDLHLKEFFTEDKQKNILKSIIDLIKISQEEKVLLLCFTHLDYTFFHLNLENADTENLLNKIVEILSKKTVSIAACVAACNFINRFFKEKEDKVSSFMHIIPKLIFLPLSHSCAKVREIAEKTLDSFPKLQMYSEDLVASDALLKTIKEPYCKDLILLMKYKLEQYVLKIWTHVLNALGKSIHKSLPAMTPFFQVIEKAFKTPSDDVNKTAFLAWKSLISNLAVDDNVLNDSKKLRFVLKPFKNCSKSSESVSSAVCDTWWHLVWNLNHNLSSRFTEVCLPLLEYTIGKVQCGNAEKSTPKGNQIVLIKKGCQILLRLLEQPPSAAFGRISSPKKLTTIPYPALQTPLNIKVIARHFKEILSMLRIITESFGNHKDMMIPLDCLMKSVLFVVSSVVEDNSKEAVEAVVLYIGLVSDITESQLCPSSTCLKCIDTLSKLPKSALVSHCFNSGIRMPQDILCVNLLKLLFNPYLLGKENANKRYLPAYNRLIQAGICESLNPFLVAEKFIHLLKSVIVPGKHDSDFLLELWSGIASPLLANIEKTQEVNQGDKQDHDFSCLYSVLLCPFEPMFPTSVPQLRTKTCFRLWTSLYKIFIRCSELVPSTVPNETCEHYCLKLKNLVVEDALKDPQTFENFCHLLQVVVETVDFASLSPVSSQGISNMLTKRKKPLGNIMSLVDLLSLVLNSFYANFIDVEVDEMYQSCTPKAQKRGHVLKAALPLDIIKIFFENLKSGSIIPFVLEELIQPLSKLFSVSQKKITSNIVAGKFESVFNVLTSSIELYYLGPYDNDFLSVMSPLLESCLGHSRRQIKERCRRFWFATFAPVSSSLKYPESLKNVMKKAKLPLLPNENISPVDEFSFTPGSGSTEDVLNFETAGRLKETLEQPSEVCSVEEAKITPAETVPFSVKENKASTKMSVDELPSNEFVKIDSPNPVFLTPRRRSVRMRKSFVPALYNDLSQSQDTTTLGGSSESYDNSCEIMNFESQEDFNKPSTSSKKEESIMKEKDIPVVFLSSESEPSPKGEISAERIGDRIEVTSEDINRKTNTSLENTFTHQDDMSICSSNSKTDCLSTEEGKQNVNIEIISSDMEISCSQGTKDVLHKISDEEKNCDQAVKVISAKSFPSTATTKKGANKSLQGRRRKILSESFSVQTPKISIIEPTKLNKSCIEVIDLDLGDSDEIIPSSQSSSESETSKQLLSTENSARTGGVLSFNAPVESKAKNPEPLISISSPMPIKHRLTMLATDDVSEECPETPADLMGSSPEGAKEPEVEIQSQEHALSVEDSATVMPLKSSENLLSCEEPNAKPDSQEIKSVLSDILKTSETKGQNVAENTPPLFDDVFVVQSALLETETKILPYTESKSLNVELKLQSTSEIGIKLDNSKPLRAKSARIATRKSLDPTAGKKKVVKKTGKRKSMANLTDIKKLKSSELEDDKVIISQVKDKIIPNSSNQIDSITETSKESEAVEESTACLFEDSVMDDITAVISDIKEKLDSNSEPNSFDEFSFKHNEQCSKKRLCVKPGGSYIAKSENNEKQSSSGKRKDPPKKRKKSLASSEEKNEILENMNETPSMNSQNTCSTQPSIALEQNLSSVNTSLKERNESEMPEQDLQCESNCDDEQDVLSEESKSAEKESGSSSELSSGLSEDSKETSCHSYLTKIINDDDVESLNGNGTVANIIPESQDNEKQCLSSEKFERALSTEQMDENVNNSVSSGFPNESLNNLEEKTSNTSQNLLNEEGPDESEPDEILTKPCNSRSKRRKISVGISPIEVTVTDFSTLNEISAIENSGPDECCRNLNETFDILDEQICSPPQESVEPKLLSTDISPSSSEDDKEFDCSQYPQNSNEMFSQDVDDTEHLLALASEKDNGNVPNEANAEDDIHVQDSVDITESKVEGASLSGELGNSEINSFDLQSTQKDIVEDMEVNDCSSQEENSPELIPPDDFEVTPNGELKYLDPSAPSSDENEDILESISKSTDIVLQVIPSPQETLPSSSIDVKKDYLDGSVNEVPLDESDGSKKVGGASRKRKTKCPVRSPFNFRQRSNILVSMIPQKSPVTPTESKGLKRSVNDAHKKPTESTEKKIKVFSINSKEKVREPLSIPMNNAHASPCNALLPSSLSVSEVEVAAKKVDTLQQSKGRVNYDEVTSINTRYNASLTTQTRRLKLLQQSVDSEHEDYPEKEENTLVDPVIYESSVIFNSILKRRKSADFSSAKRRRVRFSDPLFEERLFSKDDDVRKCVKVVAQPTDSKAKEKVMKASVSSFLLSTEEIQSSHEFENSDNLADYSNLPVCPLLTNCTDSVGVILNDLTSPAWLDALEALLLARQIHTIGDLCKLNIHELKALPFRSPKVLNLHKALMTHLERTQKATLDKLKTIDDWCSGMVTTEEETDANVTEAPQDNDEHMDENIQGEISESLAGELLCNERIKHLPTKVLVSLAEKCFGEVTQRLKNS